MSRPKQLLRGHQLPPRLLLLNWVRFGHTRRSWQYRPPYRVRCDSCPPKEFCGRELLRNLAADQPEREGRADENGRLPPRESLDIGRELIEILFFDATRPAFDLINRLIDIARDRFVLFFAKPLAARADGLRDTSEGVNASVFLCRELLCRALLYAVNHTYAILLRGCLLSAGRRLQFAARAESRVAGCR